MSELENLYFTQLNELNELYIEVKEIILLAEHINEEKDYIISSVNELRNAFDHVFKTFKPDEDVEKNFDKAKGHIYRAGYDAYEVIALDRLLEIDKIKKQFSYEAITTAFPKYNTDIIPTAKKIQKELAKARANKSVDSSKDEKEHFTYYDETVTKLMILCDEIELHLDGINEAQKSINKKKRIDTYLKSIIIPLVITIIGGIIVVVFTK